jgi:hypothetical protein
MKQYIILLAVYVYSCSSNNSSKNNVVEFKDSCFVYPEVIDSLALRSLYDSARWYIYTYNCDERYLSKSDTSMSITFGELPLKFKGLKVPNHDTLNLAFDFTDGNEAILMSLTRDTKDIPSGVGFNLTSRKKIYMLISNGTMSIRGGPNRYENPLQPEVVAYIKKNWDKLDPCFRALAAQKGLGK